MNQVVGFLYGATGVKYELLHVKSVEVRYENGLVGATLAEILKMTDQVIAEIQSAVAV
jgi:hypothetical protein